MAELRLVLKTFLQNGDHSSTLSIQSNKNHNIARDNKVYSLNAQRRCFLIISSNVLEFFKFFRYIRVTETNSGSEGRNLEREISRKNNCTEQSSNVS